jgi:SAM-dependent methyltransferase
MKTLTWTGCYDDGWKGLILEAAYQHPAKFSRGLIRRIYQHALASGYVKPGDVCVDPFGGVALGALDAMQAGLRWFGCELEPRFVELGNANLAKWERVGLTGGVLVQGDSRQLCSVLAPVMAACIVSSPPFNENKSNAIHGQEKGVHSYDENEAKSRMKRDYVCGDTPGNLGGMKPGDVAAVIEQADCCIGSPPYEQGLGHIQTESSRALCADLGHQVHEYGDTPGNLGNLPAGSVTAVVSSPPYASGTVHDGNGIDQSKLTGNTTGRNAQTKAEGYGRSTGNLGNMPTGDIAAIVSSPPFGNDTARDVVDAGTRVAIARRRRCPTEDVRPGDPELAALRQDGYGTTDGQLSAMPPGSVADCLVSSPPFEASLDRGTVSKAERVALAREMGISNAEHISPIDMERIGKRTQEYGTTPGNVGNVTGATFWSASIDILRQCHAILRPGGYAIFVCKDFVRAGKRVDFSRQWLTACEAVGFVKVEWIKASLVKQQSHPSLFGDEPIVKTTARQSFFRRLQINRARAKKYWTDVADQDGYLARAAVVWLAAYDALKLDKQPKAWNRREARMLEIAQALALDEYEGNPADYAGETEIDHEDVLIVRKPL